MPGAERDKNRCDSIDGSARTVDVIFDFAKASQERLLSLFDTASSRAGTLLSADVAAIVAVATAIFVVPATFASRLSFSTDAAMFGFVVSAIFAGFGFFGRSPFVPSLSEVVSYKSRPETKLKEDLIDTYEACYSANARVLRSGTRLFRISVGFLFAAISLLAIGALIH